MLMMLMKLMMSMRLRMRMRMGMTLRMRMRMGIRRMWMSMRNHGLMRILIITTIMSIVNNAMSLQPSCTQRGPVVFQTVPCKAAEAGYYRGRNNFLYYFGGSFL